jgi:serine/threonine protein kinase
MQEHSSQHAEQIHGKQLGNYRILRLLGQGSFADVYLGEHIHLHTQAAIKVLQVRLVESNIQSFLNEARTIAHMVHPYIIRVLDFGVEANTPFLVMDYAPQGTFRQRFLQGKPLPSTALFPFVKQAASALQYAHDKKLIHRDVKPENMLLGSRDEILLSDFGFALIQTSITRPSIETAGTASYMAPEQFQGKPQPASDQYSLGVIAYEWLTGNCPFQGSFMELASQHMMSQPPSLIQRVPGLSAQVAQVVMTALAKEPEQRFPSVRDFARALEHACLSSTNHVTASLPVVPPPFLATPPGLPTDPPANSVGSPARRHQNPQPILHAERQQPQKVQAHFQSSQHSLGSQSSLNSFPPVSTIDPLSAGRASSSSYVTFRREQTPSPSSSSSTFSAFSQVKPALPDPRVSSVWQTPGATPASTGSTVANTLRAPEHFSQSGLPPLPRPTPASTGSTVANTLHATEHFSQSGLPPLPSQQMNQHRSERANALKLSAQPFSPASNRSQSHLPVLPELPPLPQQPFLAPELTGQNSSPSTVSQTFPLSPNVSIRTRALSRHSSALNEDSLALSDLTAFNGPPSLVSASSSPLTPATPPLVRVEDFRPTAKSSTSRILIFFVIFMVALIIGSTALLVALTNNQYSGLQSPPANQTRSTPHTNAQATTASQSTPTLVSTEPNPYDNHNGILVLNAPLNQQDQQMQWSESSGTCAFGSDGYHVVASARSEGFTLCNATASDYTNFVYQVEMTFAKVSSTAGSGGLLFRGNKTNNQFYFFEIFTTGNYALYRCPGADGAGCPLLSSSKTTGRPIASFHANLNQPNTIAVVANGNAFSFYVNNQLVVGSIVDPTYSHGRIGMTARQNNTSAVTDVFFNNIKVWQL